MALKNSPTFDSRDRAETILAIPTEFDGWRCKSRTEARWLVFFKTFGIQYEFEPQGFVLNDGSCFQPDLYLPSIRFWAEIKPTYLNGTEERKCRLLADGTGFPCLFLVGVPTFKSYYAATWDSGHYTVVDYSLDVDNHWRLYEEGRLFSQPDYRTPPDENQFSAPYQHAVYSARGYDFEGKR
jgi:hypothetical protein